MKKVSRIMAVIAVLALCASLCGCNMLDELRETRATITQEGNIKLYDGSEYILLPECEYLAPDFGDFNLVYVVEEEIPLLLTQTSDTVFLKSVDGLFLQNYTDDFFEIYCRSDAYESVVERMESGISDGFYGYWYFDNEEGDDGFYMLSQAQTEAIAEVCSQEPEILPEAAALDYEYMAMLCYCSKDMLFQQNTVNICLLNGRYYVAKYDMERTALYSVPDAFTQVFAQMMEKQIESDGYWLD